METGTTTEKMTDLQAFVVTQIRRICSRELGLPEDHRFFEPWYRPGESADEALYRLFEEQRQLHDDSDDDENSVLELCDRWKGKS